MNFQSEKSEKQEVKVYPVSYIVPFRKGGVTFIDKPWVEGYLVIAKKSIAFVSKDKKVEAKINFDSITAIGRPEQNPSKMPGSKDFVLSIDYYDENRAPCTALLSSEKKILEDIRDYLERTLGLEERVRLTFEERRVLMLLSQGITNIKDIAEIMNITETRATEIVTSLISKGLVDVDGKITKKGSRIASEILTKGAELERISYELIKLLERKYTEVASSALEILVERGFLPSKREEATNKTLEEWLKNLADYLNPIGLVSDVEINVNRLTKVIEIRHINSRQAELVETMYSMYNVCLDMFTHIVIQFILQYFGYQPKVINISARGSDLMITLEVIEPLPIL